MADGRSSSLPVEQARELFFAQGCDPGACIAPHIARSWRRSGPVTHDPAPMARALLHERREQAKQLLACSQPELDGLAEHATGNGCVVVLSDATGLILEEVGSPDFLPKAERFALTPGVDWSEPCRGTNAIGTALAEREALMVLGREHYLDQNGALGCAAAPIFTGRGLIAGALDISGESARVNQHALGLVRMAAQQVEHRMLLAGADGHLLRFHRRPGLLGTAREGLLVIADGRIIGANRVALDLFDETWSGLLDRDVVPLLGRSWMRLERQRGLLTLPGGQQIAAMVERTGSACATVHVVRQETVRAVGADADAAPRAALRADAQHDAQAGTQADDGNNGSDSVAAILSRAVRVLNAGVSVLVNGETGSGKDVFARRLHAASRRRAGPFVAVDCASLPESLIEAELFGYEEGAFTGARRRGMPGRIREADGGVLFLDEIAEMPMPLQTRLLRVLEERVVTPLGGGQGVPVAFDLVCATHGDLAALARAGRFRSDLMYRVAGFTASLPPLRQRTDRHALIARVFAECGGTRHGLQLGQDARDLLAAYAWPGNMRELRSVLQTVCALAEPDGYIGTRDLPPHVRGTNARTFAAPPDPPPDTMPPASHVPLLAITRHAIDQALAAAGQDVADAARRLGVHRSTIYRHLARQRAAGPAHGGASGAGSGAG